MTIKPENKENVRAKFNQELAVMVKDIKVKFLNLDRRYMCIPTEKMKKYILRKIEEELNS